MKVAVLAHSFPRFRGDTHGPFVKSLSEALAARGHEMTVLVPFDVELAGDSTSPLSLRSFKYVWPDRWHRLGYSRTLARDVRLRAAALLQAPLYFYFAERALARLVREKGIELLHAHWILPNGYVAARVARRAGIPLAITLHGSDVFMAERNPLFGRMARTALATASHVTSCSGELAERLLRLGGGEQASKVLLVANGTDVDPSRVLAQGSGAFAGLAARCGLALEDRLVVAVGRLVDKKGFRYLLDAMPRVLERVPAARLVLGGGGDLEAELRARAASLGLGSRVVFTGMLSHPEVLALVAAAEVFVMPSIRDERGNVDGLPIVVLEAMAAAKPVIATNVSGIPLAVGHGETGWLVAEKDPNALSGALVEALEAPVEAQRRGGRGRDRVVSELNWDSVAAIHDELYRRAVQR